jgi:acyl dehydratase
MTSEAQLLEDPTAFRPMQRTAAKDLPIGFEVEPITKRMTLDKSRIFQGWPAARNRHCDYEAAHATGLPAPNINGAQTAELLGELYIKFFGESYLGGTLSFNLVNQVQLDDELTAGGILKEKTDEGERTRLILDVWVSNQKGEKVLVGTATGLAP